VNHRSASHPHRTWTPRPRHNSHRCKCRYPCDSHRRRVLRGDVLD